MVVACPNGTPRAPAGLREADPGAVWDADRGRRRKSDLIAVSSAVIPTGWPGGTEEMCHATECLDSASSEAAQANGGVVRRSAADVNGVGGGVANLLREVEARGFHLIENW